MVGMNSPMDCDDPFAEVQPSSESDQDEDIFVDAYDTDNESVVTDKDDYENLLVDEPHEDLQCPICVEFFRDPVTIPCGHSYCRACVELLSKSNKKCPLDGKQFADYFPSVALKNIINNLQIKCRFGCQEVFRVAQQDKHEMECKMAFIDCPLGCHKKIRRGELKLHETTCPNNDIRCACGRILKIANYERHLEKECTSMTECQYCKSKMKQLELATHFQTCSQRNVDTLSQLLPDLDGEVIHDILRSSGNSIDTAMSFLSFQQNNLHKVLELFNLDESITQPQVIQFVKNACPSLDTTNITFNWKKNNQNTSGKSYVWIHFPTETDAQKLTATFQTIHFPYARAPYSDGKGLFDGSTKGMTFCPSWSKVDCPFAHPNKNYGNCPLRHVPEKSPTDCFRWKAGLECTHPQCKFSHPAQTIVVLKFTSRAPNQCKICNQQDHFNWDCPTAIKAQVVKQIEKELLNNHGLMLLSQLGTILRKSNPKFLILLQKEYHGKLLHLLTGYSANFQLVDMDKPGHQKVKLIPNASPIVILPPKSVTDKKRRVVPTNSNNNNNIPPATNNSVPPKPQYSPHPTHATTNANPNPVPGAPSSPSKPKKTKIEFTSPHAKGRHWSVEFEFIPFVQNTMTVYFQQVLLAPNLSPELVQPIRDVMIACTNVNKNTTLDDLKLKHRILGERLATLRLADFEPTTKTQKLPFAERLIALKKYDHMFWKYLKRVQKACNEGGVGHTIMEDENKELEHDFIAEIFHNIQASLNEFHHSNLLTGNQSAMPAIQQPLPPIQNLSVTSSPMVMNPTPTSYHHQPNEPSKMNVDAMLLELTKSIQSNNSHPLPPQTFSPQFPIQSHPLFTHTITLQPPPVPSSLTSLPLLYSQPQPTTTIPNPSLQPAYQPPSNEGTQQATTDSSGQQKKSPNPKYKQKKKQ